MATIVHLVIYLSSQYITIIVTTIVVLLVSLHPKCVRVWTQTVLFLQILVCTNSVQCWLGDGLGANVRRLVTVKPFRRSATQSNDERLFHTADVARVTTKRHSSRADAWPSSFSYERSLWRFRRRGTRFMNKQWRQTVRSCSSCYSRDIACV